MKYHMYYEPTNEGRANAMRFLASVGIHNLGIFDAFRRVPKEYRITDEPHVDSANAIRNGII